MSTEAVTAFSIILIVYPIIILGNIQRTIITLFRASANLVVAGLAVKEGDPISFSNI